MWIYHRILKIPQVAEKIKPGYVAKDQEKIVQSFKTRIKRS